MSSKFVPETGKDYTRFVREINTLLDLNYNEDVDEDILEKELPGRLEKEISEMYKYRKLLLIFFVISTILYPLSMTIGFMLKNGWLIVSGILWIIPEMAFIPYLFKIGVKIKRIEALRKEFIARLIFFRRN